MRIAFTSPRTTAHIQTLLSSPISTSPITCALWSMKAEDATRGSTPRWGRSTAELYRPRRPGGPGRPGRSNIRQFASVNCPINLTHPAYPAHLAWSAQPPACFAPDGFRRIPAGRQPLIFGTRGVAVSEFLEHSGVVQAYIVCVRPRGEDAFEGQPRRVELSLRDEQRRLRG